MTTNPHAYESLATESVSRELLDLIASSLDATGVAHGSLVEGSSSLNLAVTDHQHVFAKISRPGELTDRPYVELQGARLAADRGLDVPTPLLNEPLFVVDEYGETRAVTLWRYTWGVTEPALLDRGRGLVGLIAALAAAPIPATAGLDLTFFANRVDRRLGTRRDSLSIDIKRRSRSAFAAAADRLDPTKYAWLHGDMHLRNVLWQVNGRPMLVDWESHCRGPVEFDVAALIRSVFVHSPGYASETRMQVAEAVASAANMHFALDWELVDLLARGRNASAASHLLLIGHDPAQLMASLAFDAVLDDGLVARIANA